jgi:Immunoglobulin domain
MKSVTRFLAVIAVCMMAFTSHGKGRDISQTVLLYRYTLVDADTFQYDTGFLYPDGTFHVATSDTEYYGYYGLSPDDLAPVSGKPLMDETLYNSYHNMGLIPKWIASSFDITIGYETFVIVGVKGKNDVGISVTITEQPESQQVIAGWSAMFTIQAEPSQYIPYDSYQWYLNGKPMKGETYSALIFPTVTTKNAGVYKCAIGGTMSQGALLSVVTPVTIKKQPASITVKSGKKASFSVVALGSSPLRYQWYAGANAIPDATNNSYTIPKVQPSDAGQYQVRITNSLTWGASSPVTLTVIP